MSEDDEALLRSAALRNAAAIQQARERAERDLREARDELRRYAERLRLALAAGHLGDWSWDAASDVVALGPVAAGLFGLPPEGVAITWAALLDRLHDDDREAAARAVGRALAERADCALEYRVRRGANERWIAATGRPTLAPDGNVLGLIGVVQDVTERRRLVDEAERVAAERERLLAAAQAARADAERVSRMKDEFLATLSHELRTPLGAILGWAQVLKRTKGGDAELAQALDIIERNTRAQARLIEELLDTSRITSGKIRLDIQRLLPIDVVEAAVETVTPAAEAKSIRLETLLDPRAGPVHGDPSRLQQAVWNLLANAIKFTDKGGRVQVLLRRVDSQVEISVADTGVGIRPPLLAQVFDRFWQADSSTTRRYGGLGLGLSIVKHLVELHGGTVEARSEGEGRGATFILHLPVAALHAVELGERLPAGTVPALVDYLIADLSGLRILVVDDEADARALIGRVLRDCGAEVVAADSAAAALALVARERPALVVTDIGLPGMDGYGLLAALRRHDGGAAIPAIALTAFARTEDRMRALRAGFRLHLAKPVEPAELVATVASVAGRAVGAGDARRES